MSPGAVAMTKRLFNRVADLPYDEALLVAKDANLSMRVMADAVEGARSFLDAKTKEEANG
jgi:enoyl-CoA hydratase/carnithine racemase